MRIVLFILSLAVFAFAVDRESVLQESANIIEQVDGATKMPFTAGEEGPVAFVESLFMHGREMSQLSEAEVAAVERLHTMMNENPSQATELANKGLAALRQLLESEKSESGTSGPNGSGRAHSTIGEQIQQDPSVRTRLHEKLLEKLK